jgi:hypothetical protein
MGAQMGAKGLTAEAAASMEQLAALADLEEARKRAILYERALRFFGAF